MNDRAAVSSPQSGQPQAADNGRRTTDKRTNGQTDKRTKGQRTGAHDRPDATTNRKKRNGNRPTTRATIKGQK